MIKHLEGPIAGAGKTPRVRPSSANLSYFREFSVDLSFLSGELADTIDSKATDDSFIVDYR